MAASLLTLSHTALTLPPTVGELFRTVPLARRSLGYYSSFPATGEFGRCENSRAWPENSRVLELSAGREAAWSCAVSATGRVGVVATDLEPPEPPAAAGVTCMSADNTKLGSNAALAAAAPFDVVFASHALCTCQWPLNPAAYLAAYLTAAPDGAARTCGGVALDPAGVDGFVAELQPLLREGTGVALFDQEGGWPWGLEQRLRASAAQRGLHLYVRRGPFLTNFGYVLSTAPLVDDLSGDPLQRDARVVEPQHGQTRRPGSGRAGHPRLEAPSRFTCGGPLGFRAKLGRLGPRSAEPYSPSEAPLNEPVSPCV